MPRPFTLAQARENQAFLEVLGQTGNARLAARGIGRAFSTMCHRRSTHAEFAQAWEAATVAAHARFHLAGGKRGPEGEGTVALGNCPRRKKGEVGTVTEGRWGQLPRVTVPGEVGTVAGGNCPLRTRGGEPVVVRTKTGRLQLRLAHPGKLTKTAEQVFLMALSATANVRLSAAAAGASPAAFYRRRRQSRAFAREFRLALERGYDRLNMEAVRAGLPESHADDAWRNAEPPAIPPMSIGQALQLLHLHEKSVRQSWDLPHRKRRRGEPWEVYRERLAAMWRCEKEREAEEAALRRALRWEESGNWRFAEEAPPPALPPLHLVTGWSKASGRPAHHEGVALFGGWRIADMERKRAQATGGIPGG